MLKVTVDKRLPELVADMNSKVKEILLRFVESGMFVKKIKSTKGIGMRYTTLKAVEKRK